MMDQSPCAVAFKEWAAVCAALAAGRQALILRKGGIAEGPGGFRPEHDRFWLLPTRFHERPDKLQPDDAGFFDQAQADPEDLEGSRNDRQDRSSSSERSPTIQSSPRESPPETP